MGHSLSNELKQAVPRIKQFHNWWFSELSSIVPRRYSSQQRQERQPALVFFARDRAFELYSKKRNQIKYRGIIDYSSDHDVNKTVKQRVGGNPSSMHRVLVIPEHQVICKTINFPKVVRENLENVLRYELDRHTPFNAQQAYFDFTQINENTTDGLITVLLRVVARSYIDPLLESLKMGTSNTPMIIVFNAEEEVEKFASGSRFLLESSQGGEKIKFSNSRVGFAFNLVVILMIITAFVIPPIKMQQVITGLRAELNQLRSQVQHFDSTRKEINQLLAGFNMLREMKQQNTDAVDLLLELTQLLPDGTWLENLEIKDRRLVIKGQSNSASTLIGIMEKSEAFSKVKFQSPVTQNQVDEFEHFIIVAEITQGEKHEG